MVDAFRDRLNQLKGQKKTIILDLQKKKDTLEELDHKLILLEECRMITQYISETNQKKITERIDDVVTTAIQSVFGEEFTFHMEITSKSNATQATPKFYKNGKEESPKLSSGGGLLAIASLALRVIFMTLKKNPTPIILLEEPFGALGQGEGELERGCELISALCDKLDIQMIITSHNDVIKSIANRVFYVSSKEKDTAKVITKDNIKEKSIMEENYVEV
jgi:ABC-type glutathione transport system ATPase component